MKIKAKICVLCAVLLFTLCAQARSQVDKPLGEIYAPGIARVLLVKSLAKRIITKRDFVYFGDSNFDESALHLSVAKLGMFGIPGKSRQVDLVFKDLAYFDIKEMKRKYAVVWPPSIKIPLEEGVFSWDAEADATQFRDAVNSFIYFAKAGDPYDLAAFSERARAWREKPETRTKPSDEMEKHRILAEQRIKERDLFSAVTHYEAGIRAYEMWSDGWFNAALLYAELEDFADAVDRMKHYLILVPDAPDAQAAREKIIVWEDKAKHP